MHTAIKSLFMVWAALCAAGLQAQVIFACEPEWAALARVLLPQARIHVATTHLQDPHHIEARPALIAQLRAADLAVCTGAGLEEGWFGVLQQRSGNPKVQSGQAGLFWATDGQVLLGQRTASGSPFEGDVHPQGNPHLHANPKRLLQVAEAMAQRMGQLWPEQALEIDARSREFQQRWQTHIQQWTARAQTLKGRRVVAQHSHFAYLWEWLGCSQVADLEPKPGLSPTPAHLQQTVQRLRDLHPGPLGVAVASHQDPRAARWVGQQLPGLAIWVWPATVSEANEQGLLSWFEGLLQDLLKRS